MAKNYLKMHSKCAILLRTEEAAIYSSAIEKLLYKIFAEFAKYISWLNTFLIKLQVACGILKLCEKSFDWNIFSENPWKAASVIRKRTTKFNSQTKEFKKQ